MTEYTKNINAPVMAKLHELGFELLQLSPYFPGLAPSCYCLFGNLKRMLQGKQFRSIDEVIAETVAYFKAFVKSLDTKVIEMLERR